MIYDYFRATGTHDAVLDYADLCTITLRNDDVQEFARCCQFHRELTDGLVTERDLRCTFSTFKQNFLLHRLIPMLKPQHSQELFTKCTTHRLREHVRWVVLSSNRTVLFLGPTSVWFGRASCVRDLVALRISWPHCYRMAPPETSPVGRVRHVAFYFVRRVLRVGPVRAHVVQRRCQTPELHRTARLQ